MTLKLVNSIGIGVKTITLKEKPYFLDDPNSDKTSIILEAFYRRECLV